MPRALAPTLRSARTRRPEEVTPLVRASRDGDFAEVSSLLSTSTPQQTANLISAAQLATAHGHASILQRLLEAGESCSLVKHEVRGPRRQDQSCAARVASPG